MFTFPGHKRKYPIPIEMTPNEKDKCKNSILKSKGKFSINRLLEQETDVHGEVVGTYYRFQALLNDKDKTVMGYVVSEATGKCDDVKVFVIPNNCL